MKYQLKMKFIYLINYFKKLFFTILDKNILSLFGLSLVLVLLVLPVEKVNAKSHHQDQNKNHILYVDHSGVLRWKDTHKAPSFFGVNYTLPFAFDFRMMKKMGINPKKEIDRDVYEMSRLGFNAFRLHIWDTQVSDSLGNFLDNEHAKLLDYLLWKLKQHGIRAILTPMNLYNNGYPQRPTKTKGFANYISKAAAPNNTKYWKVMERYLKQFVNHVNPYTGLSYKNDPNIIAVEILNEPDQAKTTAKTIRFVNALASAIRSTGWKKPIFYNLSQADTKYALAITKAKIDGGSFQWYPAGLVRGHQLMGDYLPYVDKYTIPYRNNKRFKRLAKMVYEFSSADEPNSYIYPVMARSFRSAGFQWATQFTYTPLAIAYCNTDYQTHYLNLAYTPSKAISMLIASKVFHETPLYKSFGSFPQDTTFGDFYVSYHQNLSVMNADTTFYYTNNTNTRPKNAADLKHVAGVGSSPVVHYHGWGAYFLDKLQNGIWRLEVMPDAVPVRDPFERPSPKRYVTYIEWKSHNMKLDLPNLGNSFKIKGLNKGNNYSHEVNNGSFTIHPGSYLLIRKGVRNTRWNKNSKMGYIRLGDFVAPKQSPQVPIVRHKPHVSVVAGKPVTIRATIAGTKPNSKVWLMIRAGFRFKRITMKQKNTYDYSATIPANMVRPGFIQYWIVVKNGKHDVTFPGDHPGSPFQWDYYYKTVWKVPVYSSKAPISLFNAKKDYENIDMTFQPWNRGYHREIISTKNPDKMAIQISANQLKRRPYALGWQYYVGHNISGRLPEVGSQSELVIRARSRYAKNAPLGVILVDNNGQSYRANIQLTNHFKDYHLSLSSFQPDSMLLLPRPFPGFQPFWFKSDVNKPFGIKKLQDIQFVMGTITKSALQHKKYGFTVESAWLNPK